MRTLFATFVGMKALRTLLVAAMFLLPLSLGAQSKAEKKLFDKTVKEFSVAKADKFLKKYPKSVLAPRITEMKDSVLLAEYIERNTSTLTREEALAAAPGALDAIGWKKDGVEHVLALGSDLSMRMLTPEGSLEEFREIPLYSMEEKPGALALVQAMEFLQPFDGDRKWIHFVYRNGESEYVEALYLPDGDIAFQALFYGNPLGEGKIEGQSPEFMEGQRLSAEQAWLVGRLKDNPDLIEISKADLLTDQSISWWLGKNPKADTASKLTFGLLDAESSIVQAFQGASKERGKGCVAASFDIRGYTVICIKKGDQYSIVWCEPICKNRKTDRYIRSMFFENDGTTLDVVYYKGKTTFKNKISVVSQGIWHLK